MIEIRNVSKSYGNLNVLQNLSLSIQEGAVTAIVGPSGAGKTTLLRILGSLEHPDTGSVVYDETDIFSLSERQLADFRCRNIGFIFQFHELLPEFSARENVAMPALIKGDSRKEALHNADTMLTRLGLGERLSHRPDEMSGGERQRTAIARALINHPKVILADEPTGSHDSHNRDEIQSILHNLSLKEGHTVVMVTHDPSLAAIADFIVSMADGKIISVEKNLQVSD